MSRNFLGIAISTSSIPRGYPGCSYVDSPVTPRRTPRTPKGSAAFAGTTPYRDDEHGALDAPRPLTSPSKPLSPLSRSRLERHRPPPVEVHSASSSELNSPSENACFLPENCVSTPYLLRGLENNERTKLGTFSAINIILGKTIGVGIFSVPSSIFSNVGSVGMALVVWVAAAAISFCGLAVYLDLGTALPKSGGEKVYLERIFRRPKFLAACVLMSYVVLLGFSTPNCIVLGEYLMYALGFEANRWNVRSVAVTAITVACVVHARSPALGLRLINVLGVMKMLIIAAIIVSGFASMPFGVGRTATEEAIYKQNFTSIFAGTTSQPYALASALLKALYCFRGYNTANQVLSEVRRPVYTLSVAAPSALSIVSAAYILVNIAYFCAVNKSDFASSGLVVAGHFFTNIFGDIIGSKILPLLIILSAFGSIAATSFAQARVNQEFAKDGLLPFSSFWASSSPYETPAAALFLHWLVSVVVIVVPPPGDIYTFLVELGGYPVSIISVFVAGGLLYLQCTPSERWRSPKPASKLVTSLFLISNITLLILPWIRPEGGQGAEGRFPYYAYPAAGLGVLLAGAVYWVWLANLKNWWEDIEAKIIGNAVVVEDIAMRDWRKEIKSSRGQRYPK
ncbi:hypothetical protein MMC10_010328 [Thelotrema lepadinum]|nr:hypothetical protein [Thelotrema lepadinum]